MNKFNFDFGGCTNISLYSKHIYFKSGTLDFIGNPEKVNIGLDRKEKAMAIRKAVDNLGVKKYNIMKGCIHNTEIVREIKKLTDKKQFKAEYDKELDMLIIDLK